MAPNLAPKCAPRAGRSSPQEKSLAHTRSATSRLPAYRQSLSSGHAEAACRQSSSSCGGLQMIGTAGCAKKAGRRDRTRLEAGKLLVLGSDSVRELCDALVTGSVRGCNRHRIGLVN